MNRYLVRHTTRYRYAEPVTASYGEHHLLLRDTPTQTVLRSGLDVAPAPDELRERRDLHGNRVGYLALRTPHERLEVTARSLVDVTGPEVAEDGPGWEEVRDRLRSATDDDGLVARTLALGSPQVAPSATLRSLGEIAFTPGRAVVPALRDLVAHVHEHFDFDPTATTVTTPVEQVLERRAGVCQDFAHVVVGALRSLGLGARYVSGYLETRPPPGMPRLLGADASHAWVALWVPELGWVDADPTNDQLVGDRHVTTAWGRDYGDVAPLRGVIFTDGPTDELVVEVDVLRVDPTTNEPYERPVSRVEAARIAAERAAAAAAPVAAEPAGDDGGAAAGPRPDDEPATDAADAATSHDAELQQQVTTDAEHLAQQQQQTGAGSRPAG